MLILMCLEKGINFVHMPLRSFGNCKGMVAIVNSRIVCYCRYMHPNTLLYVEYTSRFVWLCFCSCFTCMVELLLVL